MRKQLPTRIDDLRGRLNILRFYDMSGGLNTTTDPTLLLENESPDLLNCHNDQEGSIVKRSGYTKYNATTLGVGKIQGAAKFYKVNGTEHMLVAHGGKIYKDTALNGTMTEAATGLHATNDYDFCQSVLSGTEIMVISDRNGNLQKYDGSTVAQLAAKNGMLPVWHKERLFVVDPTDKTTVYASKTLDVSDFTTIANDPDTDPYNFTVGKGDGDIVTGMRIINDQLVIFKRKRIAVAFAAENTNNVTVEWAPAGIGCNSPRGIGMYQGKAYFPAEDGFYTFDGSIVEKISEAIQPTYDGIADTTKIVGECYNGKYYASYAVSGSTNKIYVLVYDIASKTWWKYKLANGITDWVLWDKGNDVFEMYGCDEDNGFIYKMWTGNKDVTAAIDFYWISKWIDYGAPERKKRQRRVYVQLEKTTEDVDVLFGYGYDFNSAYDETTINTQGNYDTLGPTGNFKLGPTGTSVLGSGGEITEKVPISGQRRWIRYRVANNAADNPVTFKGVAFYWKMKRPF